MAELYNFPKKPTQEGIEGTPDVALTNYLMTHSDKQIEKFLDYVIETDEGLTVNLNNLKDFLRHKIGYKGVRIRPSNEMVSFLINEYRNIHHV